MKFDNEKYEELLSSYHVFWMNTKASLGLEKSWNGAPKPKDRECLNNGYPKNKVLYNSETCKKKRMEHLTMNQDIDKGWTFSQSMTFIAMLFMPPISVLFTWGWCGNNVMNVCSAAMRARWLEEMFENALEKKMQATDSKDEEKIKAADKELDNVQDMVDQCGTLFTSTNIALDLPFWYSDISPPEECENRESVEITHIKDTEKYVGQDFEPKTRNSWLSCLNSRLNGELICIEDPDPWHNKKVRPLIKNNNYCPPNTTLFLNNSLRTFWQRAIDIAKYAKEEPDEYGYPANVGSEVPGPPISTLTYLKFWAIQFVIAPIIVFKMRLVNFIYSLYGSSGEDVRLLKQEANKHGNEKSANLNSKKILEAQKRVGGAPYGVKFLGKSFGHETIPFILTPVFPHLFPIISFLESFYMFFIVISAFVGKACGKIWPLRSGAFMKPLKEITNWAKREALLGTEKETNTWMYLLASIGRVIGGMAKFVFAVIAAFFIGMLFFMVGMFVASIIGPLLTTIISIFVYIIGPILGGDSLLSGLTGHFLTITGMSNEMFDPWIFIKKYKWLLIYISLYAILSTKAITVVLDKEIISIIWVLLVLSIFPGSPVGSWIGLYSKDSKKTDAKGATATAKGATATAKGATATAKPATGATKAAAAKPATGATKAAAATTPGAPAKPATGAAPGASNQSGGRRRKL